MNRLAELKEVPPSSPSDSRSSSPFLSELRLTSEFRRSFRFSSEELERRRILWEEQGWPISLLERDHFTAKVFEDNSLFDKFKFYGHQPPESSRSRSEHSVLVLYKKSDRPTSEWFNWYDLLDGSDASDKEETVRNQKDQKKTKNLKEEEQHGQSLPHLEIDRTRQGDFRVKGVQYTEEGFVTDSSFRFPKEEFDWHMKKWIKEGWPVQFLMSDHYGAKVLFDNQVLQFIEFYGHEYRWSEDEGLSILFKKDNAKTTAAKFTPWKEIASVLSVQRTPQGWLLFDGYIYNQEGLVPHHLWQWKKLKQSYQYPPDRTPKYCYVDIITASWEHKGLPGLGIDGTSQGHNMIEFSDDYGKLYSVGMYMDPRSLINTKKTPAATVKAVLFSPDHYLPARGEKSIHRYSLGKGGKGRAKIERLKRHLEGIQAYTKTENGQIVTCTRKYQAITDNCGTFMLEIEKFVVDELEGELVKIDEKKDVFPPYRRQVTDPSLRSWKSWFWNNVMLYLLDFLLFFVIYTPWLKKKLGVGLQDDFTDFENVQKLKKAVSTKKKQTSSHLNAKKKDSILRGMRIMQLGSLKPNFGKMIQRVKKYRMLTPRRQRLDQMYSPRLRNFTFVLDTEEGKKQ
eukprot:TRINITY_DN5071_c0_g1_i1.p1 TRINITY_DN5071_c0_g1~~TRINITY_DN5071_c0_g1_i1.p1  ORF type:complete len:622 (-),score=169.20 TRINITY_DN5071_c0_g1_i1:42-1907(-)